MSRATVRAALPDAERVAAAVRPDDTGSIATRVEDGAVVATIDRPSTAGLRATLDDYLVNLALARTVGAVADGPRPTDHHDPTDPTDHHDSIDPTDHQDTTP